MYLGLKEENLLSSGGNYTAREISGQPLLWGTVAARIKDNKNGIKSFLDTCFKETNTVIITGAGTSSYIGLSLQGLYSRKFRKNVSSVPSTDLVTHPGNYFFKDRSVLLISFARSGNSPESTAATQLADNLSLKCFHLIITCDPAGNLANYQAKHSKYLMILPPEANDKALAMTGSYSGMLLAGILIAFINELEGVLPQVDILYTYGKKILDLYIHALKRIAIESFDRAVFLGSGPFYGTASEAHLKLQELTNGKIVCKRETFLGLRHGPKAVVQENTLVVYFFSKNSYVLQYEKDLAFAISKDHHPAAQIAISECADIDIHFDLTINLSDQEQINEDLLPVCYILPAQILGFYKSLYLGLKPDSPSENNVISRVVEGVQIYNYR